MRFTQAGQLFTLVIFIIGADLVLNDRVHLTMANDLIGWNANFGFKPYGDDWKTCRKLFVHEFRPSAISRLQPNQLRVTHELLRELLDASSNSGEECMDRLRT